MRSNILIALSGLVLTLSDPLHAQELSGSLGQHHAIGDRPTTYTWQFQYLQPIAPDWGFSLSWLNEGHLPDHHRDGAVLQGWRFHQMKQNRLRLGIGLGLYRSFDTTDSQAGVSYQNQHDLNSILSLQAQYPFEHSAWAWFAQINRTLGPASPRTQSLLLGLNLHLAKQSSAEPRRSAVPSQEANNELALLFGRTILNSFESETSELLESFALDYRRKLGSHLDGSLTYCDEGGMDAARRDGIALQFWLSARSPDNAWLVSFGLGPYLTRVFPNGGGESTVNIRTSVRYSMLVGRHLSGHWSARMQWNRTLTHYDRDTDALLAGMAYQW